MEAERFQPEGAVDEPTPDPMLRQEVRTCRIERWRGYVTSRFFVLTDEGLVLESKAFRWRHAAPPPETERARAAYDELVNHLEAEGWAFFEEGTPWFATTFARTVLVSTQAPVPHQPDPVPGRVAVASPVLQTYEEEIEIIEPEVAPGAGAEPEPESVRAVEGVAPPPPQQPARRWLRPRSVLLAIPIATVAAGGTLFAVHGASAGPDVHHHKTPPSATNIRTPPATKSTLSQPVEQAPAAPQVVNVEFVAHGNGSWMEVLRGSKTGKVLYNGTLEPGERLHFAQRRLWVEIGAAGNLSITSDGKPVVLSGTVTKLFRAGKG